MFTGRLPHELAVDFLTPLGDEYPTLAEVLAGYGYDTAGFVANSTLCHRFTGLARGFRHYEDQYSPLAAIHQESLLSLLTFSPVPPKRKSAERLNADFLKWLGSRTERPFFAFLNYFDAHDPYRIFDPQFDTFSQLPEAQRRMIREGWLIQDFDGKDPVELQLAIDTYEASIAYIDHHIGLLLEALERQGVLRNTIVIITTDHGEHFGEHGLFGHATSLFRQLIDAPLLVLDPDSAQTGIRIETPVSLTELPATIVALIDPGSDPPFPGRSMAHFLLGEETPRDDENEPLIAELCQAVNHPDYLNADGPIQSVIADGLHYIRYEGLDREELYDYQSDPLDQHDLASTEQGKARLGKFRGILMDIIAPGERSQ